MPPKQVLDADKEADKLINGDVGEELDNTAIEADAPEIDEPEQEEQETQKDTAQEEILNTEDPAANVPEEPVQEDDGLELLKKEVERLKQANIVLDGKYHAEVVDVLHENKKLREQLASQTEKPKEKPAEKQDLLADLRADWDEDTLKLVETVSERKLRLMREELKNEYDQRLTAHTQGTFNDRMRFRVPNFDELNKNTEFMEWLDQPDGFSGSTIYDALQDAANRDDVDTAVRIFTSYKGSKPTPEGEIVSPQSKSRQLVPKKVKSLPSSNKEQKVYSREEYAQLMGNISRGKYSPEQAKKLEAKLDKAITEGRIR